MRWLLLVLYHLVLTIVGLIVLVPLLLRLPATARRLPMWAARWDNYTDGIDGDPPYQAATAGWSMFRRRYNWLAWRNKVHNWSRYVGCVQGTAVLTQVGRYPSDYHGREGRVLTVAIGEDGRAFWQDYGCWKWPGLNRCVRWRFGWKFREVTPDDPLPAGYIAALVYFVHPFKRFGPRS